VHSRSRVISRARKAHAIIGAALFAASACATKTVTGKREFSLMSEDQEVQIGQAQDAQVRKEMGVYADRELQSYVRWRSNRARTC
jgi:predicted Zn-dependent protease